MKKLLAVFYLILYCWATPASADMLFDAIDIDCSSGQAIATRSTNTGGNLEVEKVQICHQGQSVPENINISFNWEIQSCGCYCMISGNSFGCDESPTCLEMDYYKCNRTMTAQLDISCDDLTDVTHICLNSEFEICPEIGMMGYSCLPVIDFPPPDPGDEDDPENNEDEDDPVTVPEETDDPASNEEDVENNESNSQAAGDFGFGRLSNTGAPLKIQGRQKANSDSLTAEESGNQVSEPKQDALGQIESDYDGSAVGCSIGLNATATASWMWGLLLFALLIFKPRRSW